MRAVPLLVVALLLVSTPAMAMVAADPIDAADDSTAPAFGDSDAAASLQPPDGTVAFQTERPAENDTTSRLSLPDPVRRSYVAPTADLSTTIANRGIAIENDYETFSIRREFDGLSESEQREKIDAALDRVEERIDALEERERRAVADHAAGEIGDDRLVRTLAQVHHESTELDRTLQVLKTQADVVPGYSIQGEARTLEGVLEVHRSPVRERIGALYLGASEPERPSGVVYLETSEDGVVLSVIDDRSYVREAVRYDNRDADGESRYDDIREVPWEELYPWVLDREGFHPAPNYYPFPGAQLYSISVSHPEGSLHTHLDGATGEIYREVQQLKIAQLPTVHAGTWIEDGLEVSINQTPFDGPIEVEVTDAETNASVHADVEVDGVPLGGTEGDSLWVIPPSDEYEVTVRDGDRSANATVEPWR